MSQDPFESSFDEQQGPTHWPSLLPDEARPAWASLSDWVERLVDRFALETRVVPPCWYRHNTLVESLSALRPRANLFCPECFPERRGRLVPRAARDRAPDERGMRTDPMVGQ